MKEIKGGDFARFGPDEREMTCEMSVIWILNKKCIVPKAKSEISVFFYPSLTFQLLFGKIYIVVFQRLRVSVAQ